MGYESRVKIMTKPNDMNWADDLCTMNLCCMGNGFNTIFDQEVNFNVYFKEPYDMIVYKGKVDDYNPTTEDKYGEKLKYAYIDTVINWIIADGIDYRRSFILLETLRAYREQFGNNLIVVHFGY